TVYVPASRTFDPAATSDPPTTNAVVDVPAAPLPRNHWFPDEETSSTFNSRDARDDPPEDLLYKKFVTSWNATRRLLRSVKVRTVVRSPAIPNVLSGSVALNVPVSAYVFRSSCTPVGICNC